MKKGTVISLIFISYCMAVPSLAFMKLISRPNVVLIIIDTLRADKLGCYGFPKNISPEIDLLAQKGVLFEKVIAQSSWTRPSIGSLITSLYPRSIGLYKEQYDILDGKYLTFAEILKEHGYTTIGITANPNINSSFNFHQGFDHYIDSNVIWKWMKSEGNKQTYDDKSQLLPSAQQIFQQVLDIAKSTNNRPYYVQIIIMEVHENMNLLRPEYNKNFLNLENNQHPSYYDAIRQVSFDIDQFINKLSSLPGWSNTLFILTSDHGEGLDDHPGVENSKHHGKLLYESQLLVPLIWYHPQAKENSFMQGLRKLLPQTLSYLPAKKITQSVQLMDLMPTVLEYLKLPLPPEICGQSLLNMIYEDKSKVKLPPYIVAETNFRAANKIAIYSSEWKYIENRDNQKGVNQYELQPIGVKENGIATDRIQENEAISLTLKEYLNSWEKFYKKEPSSSPQESPTPDTLNQLKSLGYLN